MDLGESFRRSARCEGVAPGHDVGEPSETEVAEVAALEPDVVNRLRSRAIASICAERSTPVTTPRVAGRQEKCHVAGTARKITQTGERSTAGRRQGPASTPRPARGTSCVSPGRTRRRLGEVAFVESPFPLGTSSHSRA